MRFSFALALTYLTLTQNVAAQVPPSDGVKWWFTAIDVSGYPSLVDGVDKVPLVVRQIPVHPDDPDGYDVVFVQFPGIGRIPQRGPGYRLATVPDDHVDMGRMLGLSVGLGRKFQVAGLRVLVGATYNLPFTQGPHRDSSGNTREWNYFGGGSTRGYGTALAYYTVTTSPRWLIPGAQLELSQDRQAFRWLGGYRMTPYKLVFETGWDRFDRLEDLKSFDISDNYIHTFYAGVGWAGLQFTIGPSVQTVNRTEIGRVTDVHYPSVVWRIGTSYSVALWR